MISLCVDARMARSSGIGTCIRELVPFLNQPPFHVILLVDQKDQLWCKNIDQIFCSSPIYSMQEQLVLPLKIPRCDLFWSPHYNIPLLPIKAKKRAVTIHDACHLYRAPYLSWPEKVYAKFVMKQAIRSDIVITDSQFSKDELIRYLGCPKNEIHVIPIAVDHNRFQRIKNSTVNVKYNLPEKFVLFVGNQKPHKNLPALLKAFSEIALPDFGLVIVGKRNGLRHSFGKAEAQRVYFLENVPDEDLPGLYSLATCLVLPSFYEGFGLPPLEAMSCGCPTIVSQTASLPEVCGDASLFIDPNRPEEIRDAILKVHNDPETQNRLIQRGYERVKTFNWANTAQHYRELFERAHKGF